MDHQQYIQVFGGTAVTRAKRRGLARNAAIALGNSGDPRAEPILAGMLTTHDEPLARGHAAWALGRLCGAGARRYLARQMSDESDTMVRTEILAALDEANRPAVRH
jgi:epoxyqueuosine reductase